MLVTERTSDGRTIVRLHKDWHIGRLGSAHYSSALTTVRMSREEEALQKSYINEWIARSRARRLAVPTVEPRLHEDHQT